MKSDSALDDLRKSKSIHSTIVEFLDHLLEERAGTAALCGVAFAVAASIVFAIFLPVINRQSKKASDGKNNNDVQIATQQPGIDDSNDAYSENGTQSTESGISSEPSLQTYQPTLADYQAVQNQLYSVGASASKFVVGVTGVTDATDIFNNSYETEGHIFFFVSVQIGLQR